MKFVFTDADTTDQMRVDFIHGQNWARLTTGSIQRVQPLLFGEKQKLAIHVWCDGIRIWLTVDAMPVFEGVLIGKRFNGHLGLGTYDATAEFWDLDIGEFIGHDSRDDVSGLTEGLAAFANDHDFGKTVFVMMRFTEKIPRLNKVYEVLKDELDRYGLRACRALSSEAQYHKELWSNIRIFMNGCRYGVAILETLPKPEAGKPENHDVRHTNPNVALELGYMIRSGKDCLLLKEESAKIQSDLIGHIWHPFRIDDLETVREQARIWCENVLGRLHC